MWRGNDDRVHLAGFYEHFAIGEGLERLESFQRGHRIAHGDKFAAGDLLVLEVFGVISADVPQTDDAKADLLHGGQFIATRSRAQTIFLKTNGRPQT
jgi:hypothetical protein